MRQAGVMNLLGLRNDVNVDLKDNSGISPLAYAAEKGFEEAVDYLLSRVRLTSTHRIIVGELR
ncbi:hypothetical protein K469DRAFT_783308 [Zopfia rhizophila CBS 207.26]|uniref:Uncharacterized protein n=1 Tax=Zopfia rhizophila CBS 207.26 TaxID=1314779 RepID=A0A6A6EQ48_9PEZI|nr:hypothetical protein K469DRAFT_783308 [Zopfia rhizophila CBS 207.26]